MHTASLQAMLFQHIKEKLPPQESLVEVVSARLHLSNDSAYRRIRGETLLVLEEARLLCEAFAISMDELLERKGTTNISFQVFSAHQGKDGFEGFLQTIIRQLSFINSATQKEIIYLTKDIPIFHQFSYQPLFAFRYFFWMKTILQHPDFIQRSFSVDCLPPHISTLGRELVQLYNQIPTTEIWNSECMNSMMSQIEYYQEAGFFATQADLELVYAAARDTIGHIRAQAEHGCKYRPGESPELKKQNLNFYYNRVVLGDNTILVLTDGQKAAFLNHDVLDYIMTSDVAFCNSVHHKLLNLMRRATIISSESEKQRSQFFNRLLGKLHKTITTNTVNGLPQ